MYLIQISSNLLEIIVMMMVALLGGGLFQALWGRKLTKAQVESIILQDNERLLKKIEINEKKIKVLQDEAALAKADNEECKLLHSLFELEIVYLKKNNAFHGIEHKNVFVVDDDPEDLEEFRKIFDKSSVLDYKGYLNIEDFLKDVTVVKPPCVVIDFNLGKMTAVQVIDRLGYEPEIFIMSGEAGYEKRFLTNSRVRFFIKEGHYVFEIAQAVIKYLIDKK
jgi:hypothetical protein